MQNFMQKIHAIWKYTKQPPEDAFQRQMSPNYIDTRFTILNVNKYICIIYSWVNIQN